MSLASSSSSHLDTAQTSAAPGKGTPGIFKGLINAILFRFDYNSNKVTCMDLHKYFEGKPFKLKILNLEGADMCLESKDFISDINFTESHKEFINMLTDDKYQPLKGKALKVVNYYDKENWTLTYQLRGYTTEFSDTPIDKIKSYLGGIIYKILKNYDGYYDDEYEDEESEDPYGTDSILASRENQNCVHIDLLTSFIKKADQTFRGSNWIYIDKSECTPTEAIHITENKIEKTRVLEIRSDKGNLFGILIKISVFSSPNLNEFKLHSNEGAYAAGINKYAGGLVLIGEQNSAVMYYGRAVDEHILTPDAFLSLLL